MKKKKYLQRSEFGWLCGRFNKRSVVSVVRKIKKAVGTSWCINIIDNRTMENISELRKGEADKMI